MHLRILHRSALMSAAIYEHTGHSSVPTITHISYFSEPITELIKKIGVVSVVSVVSRKLVLRE
jgi:hypothetical protein